MHSTQENKIMRKALTCVAVVAAIGTLIQAASAGPKLLTLDQALAISKETGRPILAVAGDVT